MIENNIVYKAFKRRQAMKKRKLEFNPKDVPKIKKVVNLLNEKFKKRQSNTLIHHDGTPMKLFIGFFPQDGLRKVKKWHICCGNIWVYDHVKMKALKKVVEKRYPELDLIFACVWTIGIFGMVKDKEGTIIK